MVEGHVALALVVPLIRTGGGLVVVLVVDLGMEAGVDAADDVVDEEPRGCVPLLQPEVEHLCRPPGAVSLLVTRFPSLQRSRSAHPGGGDTRVALNSTNPGTAPGLGDEPASAIVAPDAPV